MPLIKGNFIPSWIHPIFVIFILYTTSSVGLNSVSLTYISLLHSHKFRKMKTITVFTLLSGAAFAALVVDISKNLETRPRLFSCASIPVTLTNNISRSYTAEFTVGTPPQKVVLVVDTGSSDVWMPSSTAGVCVHGQCIGKSCKKCSLTKFWSLNAYQIE
jgi:predicted aspartyl protease